MAPVSHGCALPQVCDDANAVARLGSESAVPRRTRCCRRGRFWRSGDLRDGSGHRRMIGGRYFGRLADRSSRRLMANGALFASLLIIALLLVAQIPGMKGSVWLYSGGFFLLALIHTGVRVGRKTYIIDMAEPDQVAEYVARSDE